MITDCLSLLRQTAIVNASSTKLIYMHESPGHVDDRIPFVDHLLDLLVLELDGTFRYLHLHLSISVF